MSQPKEIIAVDSSDVSLEQRVEMVRAMFGKPQVGLSTEHLSAEARDIVAKPRIAVIDDQPINVKVVEKYLKMAGYEKFYDTTDATQATAMIRRERPDVVLLDIMMPHVSGLEILAELRNDEQFVDLPVIILTAVSESQTKMEAYKLGATEFLQKPVDPVELEIRLRNVLVAKSQQDAVKRYATELEREVAIRTAKLAQAHHEVVRCLARVGEYRDNETGDHITRVGKYSEIIAKHLGLPKEIVRRIGEAAPLHDIGKVGIPDSILLKPGKLDEVEFSEMKQHCEYGRVMCSMTDTPQTKSHARHGMAIIAESVSPVLKMAGTIAFSHHERWDGKGYPNGLKGEEIPIEARIVAVADVFDALTSKRPYKPAFSLERSLRIIREGSGTQFDANVVDAFFSGLEEVTAVRNELGDTSQEPEED